jgi:hypothetical protein
LNEELYNKLDISKHVSAFREKNNIFRFTYLTYAWLKRKIIFTASRNGYIDFKNKDINQVRKWLDMSRKNQQISVNDQDFNPIFDKELFYKMVEETTLTEHGVWFTYNLYNSLTDLTDSTRLVRYRMGNSYDGLTIYRNSYNGAALPDEITIMKLFNNDDTYYVSLVIGDSPTLKVTKSSTSTLKSTPTSTIMPPRDVAQTIILD